MRRLTAHILTPKQILPLVLQLLFLLRDNILPVIHVIVYLYILDTNRQARCQNEPERVGLEALVVSLIVAAIATLLATVSVLLVGALPHYLFIVFLFQHDLRHEEADIAQFLYHLLAELISELFFRFSEMLISLLLAIERSLRPPVRLASDRHRIKINRTTFQQLIIQLISASLLPETPNRRLVIV